MTQEKTIKEHNHEITQLTNLHRIQMLFFLLSSTTSGLFPNLQMLLLQVRVSPQLNGNLKSETMIPIAMKNIDYAPYKKGYLGMSKDSCLDFVNTKLKTHDAPHFSQQLFP